MIPENKKEANYISLHNLSESQVTALLVSLFECHPSHQSNERVQPLSKLILKKTGGNIFYIVQLLEFLQQQHLLFYDTLDNEWTWDLAAITLKANASENVVQFLTQVIENNLPGEVRAALAMASCLGFVFHVKVLTLALQMTEDSASFFAEHATTSTDNCETSMLCQRLQDSLRYASEEGLIESVSKDGSVFKWSHDKLLECCYSNMAERQDIELLHLQIGRAMHQKLLLEEAQDDSFLFLTVAQMNRGSARIDRGSARIDQTSHERIDLVELNLRAGEKARSLSAFQTASEYLAIARRLVIEDDWKNEFVLTLELYTMSAETEFSCGNYDTLKDLLDQIESHGQTIEDKMRAWYLRVAMLGQSSPREGSKEACRVLGLLGQPMPFRPSVFRLGYEFFQVRAMVNNCNEDDLLNLPTMEGKKDRVIMKLLQFVDYFGRMDENESLMTLSHLRQMQHTLKNGMSDGAGATYAVWGIVKGMFGDVDGAYRFGQLATTVADNWEESQGAIPKAYASVYTCINHMKEPLAHSVDPLLMAYRAGLESGEAYHGGCCMSAYMGVYITMGLPIGPLLGDMEKFIGQLQEGGQGQLVRFIRPMNEFARILAGKQSSPLIIDETDLPVYRSTDSIWLIYLQYIQNDIWEARNTLRRVMKTTKEPLFDVIYMSYHLRIVSALICYGIYRLKPKRKYIRMASKFKKWFRTKAQKGDINVPGMLQLVEAEEAATLQHSTTDQTRKIFDQAIQSLRQGSFTAFAAIANERAGDAMARFNDPFWRDNYYRSARLLYKEWGATTKAEEMKAKLGNEESSALTQSHVLTVRGRSRFDAVNIENSLEGTFVSEMQID
eukprot:Sro98_g050530.2  (840) ;mRNA; f:79081-81600